MRSRAQSRNGQRNKSPSPTPSSNTVTMPSISSALSASLSSKKSTKFPQITNSSSDEYINPSPSTSPTNAAGSGLIVGVSSQQGKRPYQEDEYHSKQFLVPLNADGTSNISPSDPKVETHFFGLFDGHAGGKCSKYISSCLSTTLAEDHQFVTNLPQALKRSFHTANEQFLKIAEKMKLHDGSTGIVAIVRDTKVLVANVGDCRCLIISGGRAIQMSIDQKPTDPGEQKRIAALGGTVVYCMGVARVNRVLAVSRAFGNRTLRTVIKPDAEMMQRELTRDDDYLVMASDGLWDVLKNKDVSDVCYSSYTQGNPQLIADELTSLALQRGSMDNVTCQVVKLSDYVSRILNGGGTATPSGNKTGSNVYPGINLGPGSLSRAGSFQMPPATTGQQTGGYYTNNSQQQQQQQQQQNNGTSDASGHKRILSSSSSTPNNIALTNSNNGSNNMSKQYSLGNLPQNGSYNNGSFADNDNETVTGGNGLSYQIKRMATPNRVAPLTKTPSGNGLLTDSNVNTLLLGSPKTMMKKSLTASSPIANFAQEDLNNEDDNDDAGHGAFSPQGLQQLNVLGQNGQSAGLGPPSASGKYAAQRQQEMDEQFMFPSSTPSRKNSLMSFKGTAVSQSFGSNAGSSKNHTGMQEDIASFSAKQQQGVQGANGQQVGGGLQRAATLGVNSGNALRVAINSNSAGSQSPSLHSMFGTAAAGNNNGSPKSSFLPSSSNTAQQTQHGLQGVQGQQISLQQSSNNNGASGAGQQSGNHTGFAPKKMPSLSGEWSAAASQASNSNGYHLIGMNNDSQQQHHQHVNGNGHMPPLFGQGASTSTSPSNKRLLQQAQAH